MRLTELKCIDENINLDEYISFRENVKTHMEHPEWLGDFTKEDLTFLLNNDSKIWIYYLKDEPICSMMTIPSRDKDLKKFEIDLNYKEVIDYGPIFVNFNYVGNGLQYQMIKFIDNYSKKKGYKYAIVTIHPDNLYCINNFLKDEFMLINTKEFTRGIRNIYIKKL